MTDRTVAPANHPIQKIAFPQPDSFLLDNGIEVVCFNLADEDVVKIEFVVQGGKWSETKPAVATMTARMVKEGTRDLSAAQFADQIDFYGATFQAKSGLHTVNFTLFSLNKYLPVVMPLVREALTQAAFRQEELDLAQAQARQKLSINLEKVDYVAQRIFLNNLFGDRHPYGSLPMDEHYTAINPEDLRDHYNSNYLTQNLKVVVAGKVPSGFGELMNKEFGQLQLLPVGGAKKFIADSPGKIKKVDDWPEAQQSALRLGKQMITKQHPDYHGLQVLNTAFGGYFGSRLMKNIREEKGFTYGIYSSIVGMPEAGYFCISTEVGKQFRAPALAEIYAELIKLVAEEIPDQELATVKNNMLGNILETIDGPFNLAGTYKSLLAENLDFGYLYDFVQVIKSITPPELKSLATKYFNPDEISEFVVG